MGTHTKLPAANEQVVAILDSIRRIVRALRVGSRAAEKSIGLSGAQLFVLQALKDSPATSINELAERTRTDQSSVSVVVHRLVDRGLVDRIPFAGDARRVELSLTAKGRRLLADAPAAAQDRLIAALEQLSAADQTHLAALLSEVVLRMGESDGNVEMFFEEMPAKAIKAAP
jgi:DNA-binding MarR family transcriptional regulator